MKVWVLRYSHRHGTDISVFRKKSAAYAQAVVYMKEWMHEIPDEKVKGKIQRRVRKGTADSISDAMRLWSTETEELIDAFEETVL